MSFRLREIIKNPDTRAILSWLGGGAVVAAGGIWTVVTFVDHKDASDKKGGTVVTLSGQGINSGRDTNIGGNVNIGPDKEQIEQIEKPLAEQLATKGPDRGLDKIAAGEKSGGWARRAAGRRRGGGIDRARRSRRRHALAASIRPLEGK